MEKSKVSLKERYFCELTDSEVCKKAIKQVAQGFYFIAGLAIVMAFLPIPQLKGMWLDGLIYVVLALFLDHKQSRIAAVVLVLLAGWAAGSTFLNMIGITHEGGSNIFLAIIMFVYAMRGVQATFRYHKLKT